MARFALAFLLLSTIATAQSPVPLKIIGDLRKLILLSDGTVRLTTAGTRAKPATLASVPLPGKATDIATTGETFYALLEDGAVYAWGKGDKGALGLGPNPPANAASPVRVPGLPNITQIAASGAALALTREGTVYAWGSRDSGEVGDGRHPKRYGEGAPPAFSPVLVPNASNIMQIASMGHVLALTREGRVLTWGSNSCGALGRAPRRELPIDEVGEVPNLTGVKAIATGQGVSHALKQDGSVWVWGCNWFGQFGNGLRTDPPGVTSGWDIIPQQVKGVTNVVAMSLGNMGRHTLVLLKDGTLRGWGNTDWGQLGGGVSATFQERPMIPKIAGVKAVFGAGNNSFAVRTDNSVWAWGAGDREDWPFRANTSVPTRITIE